MKHLDQETVRWAYRLFLDREPESEAVLSKPATDTRSLREEFLNSYEFKEKNRNLLFDFDSWVIKESVHGFRIRVSLAETGISRPILRDAYDTDECILLKSLINRGDHVFDIGANIGFYSLYMGTLVGPQGCVTAFEPIEYLFQSAAWSIRENGFQDFVHIHQLALSDASGRAKIRHAPKTTNFGGGHIAADENTPPNHVDAEVVLQTLQQFSTERKINLLKIDVEGAEPRVIAGGTEFIRRDHPAILSELHNGQLKKVSDSTANAYISTMQGLGYKCLALPGREEIERYDRDEPTNVLFQSS